jgi:hypothetical protein
MTRSGVFLVLVVAIALAAVRPAVAAPITNGAILESLNLAHARLESGDKDGAKAELKSLSDRLEEDGTANAKALRRRVNWCTIQLTVGYVAGAEKELHALIRDVSSAGW